jgi:hypothetical protein
VAPGEKIDSLSVNTRNGFLRLNLQNQDFLHQEYAFVLSRQMMALSQLPSDKALEGAVYIKGNTVIVFTGIGTLIGEIQTLFTDIQSHANTAEQEVDNIITGAIASINLADPASVITVGEFIANLSTPINNADAETNTT